MDEWYCMNCGKQLVKVKLDEGDFPCCLDCAIKYTIHGTGVGDSLFVVGADSLKITF
jgi:hypothetical protein